MRDFSIRQAVLADLPALATLFDDYRQFYGRESDVGGAREFLRARFDHGESVIFIATDTKPAAPGALGFVQLYPSFSSVFMVRTFVLNDLFVAQAARRRGVAGGLLGAAAQHAGRVRAIRLSLSTLLENTSAQALYQKHGWQVDEKFQVFHKVI